MTQTIKILLLMTITVFLAGCGAGKEYVVPDDPDAQSCISSCGTIRAQCRAQVQDRYRVCRNNYEYQDRLYSNCVRTGNKACMKPPRCPAPDTRGCSSQYDGCYQSCGGVIKTGQD